MRQLFSHLLLVLAICAVALPARAEGKGDEDKRARVEQRMKQVRNKVLRQHVGLDDKKADEVLKVLAKYEPERRKLQRQQQEHRRALRDLLQADSNDDAEYKKQIDGFRSAQKKLSALRDKETDEVAKLITPKQQAKLYGALERLRKKLARRGRPSD